MLEEENSVSPPHVKTKPRLPVTALLAVFLAGCVAGFFARPALKKHLARWMHGNGARKAAKGYSQTKESLAHEVQPPTEKQINSWLKEIRNMQKDLKDQKAAKDRDLRKEKISYNILVNKKKADPESEECIRLKSRMIGLQSQIKQLDSYIADLTKLDRKLCLVIDEIRTSGTIEKKPQMIKLISALENFLSNEEIRRKMREGTRIPHNVWSVELEQN